LNEKKLLSRLPEELISTAKMRLENPEMSLSQLAMHSIPPLTKSGISHRMAKITKLAEELLKKQL
jgi:DNA-binding protein WhiA